MMNPFHAVIRNLDPDVTFDFGRVGRKSGLSFCGSGTTKENPDIRRGLLS